MREVIVGDRDALLTPDLRLTETNWLGDESCLETAARAGRRVLARVRSTRPPTLASLRLATDGGVEVAFDQPQEAVSPGQACVLYDADDAERVLGGGFIARAAPLNDGASV